MSIPAARDDRGFLARVVLGSASGPEAALVRALLCPASAGYRLVVALRNGLYDIGLKRSARLSVPVISIGNLSVGGVGKTPFAEWLARRLIEWGRRPAIVSRGYRAPTHPGDAPNEEVAMLAESLAQVPQVQNPDRVEAGRRAISEADADVIILDDGFQHRRLHREFDIVLIDALVSPRRDHLLPWGSLREPLASLRRAQAVVITRSDLVGADELAGVRALLSRMAPAAAFAEARHAPVEVSFVDGRVEAPEWLRGRRVFAFCGIGNPEGFRLSLEALGADLCGWRYLPDHHAYGGADVQSLARAVGETGAELAVTTHKDAVKVRSLWTGPPLGVLKVRLEVAAGLERLESVLKGALGP